MGGPNYAKNQFLPVPEIQDAVAYFQNDPMLSNSKPILLNFGQNFSLDTKNQSSTYIPIDVEKRKQYIKNVASKFKHVYESEEVPTAEALVDLFKTATARLKRKQKEINFFEDLNLVFDISEDKYACINLLESDVHIIDDLGELDNYHRFQLDPRLLKMALMGPAVCKLEQSGNRRPAEFCQKAGCVSYGRAYLDKRPAMFNAANRAFGVSIIL